MDRIKRLNVLYHERKVGTLALYNERLAAFEYGKEWIESGFSISPFSYKPDIRLNAVSSVMGLEWLIKFPSYDDRKDIEKQEYAYSLCAKECGIEMTETKLFPSERCAGYFGKKRFDRKTDNKNGLMKIHMISISAVLETSHRIPNLDYHLLMKLT